MLRHLVGFHGMMLAELFLLGCMCEVTCYAYHNWYDHVRSPLISLQITILILYCTRIICTVHCTIVYKCYGTVRYEKLNLPSNNASVHPVSRPF